MKISTDHGQTWTDADEVRVEHEISVGEMPSYLYHTMAEEGVIRDVYRGDIEANVATSSAMAQEITEAMIERAFS